MISLTRRQKRVVRAVAHARGVPEGHLFRPILQDIEREYAALKQQNRPQEVALAQAG